MTTYIKNNKVQVKASIPAVQLEGTEASGLKLELRENAGNIELYDVTNAVVRAQWSGTTGKRLTPLIVATEIAADAVITAKILDANVTYAKIQNVSATDKLLGRSAAGAGVTEEITCTAAGRALLDDVDAVAQLITLGLTAAAAELNILDGALLTVAELNYVGGVTSAIQTQFGSKVAKTGDTMTGDLNIFADIYHHKKPDIPSQNYMLEQGWTNQTSASAQIWYSVTWSPELGLFCALASAGVVGVQVMTSPDGITWTSQTSASELGWSAIIWSPELGLFCAVAKYGAVGVQVMTSPDGITWTSRTSASAQQWMSITWSPELGLFCAVAANGLVGVQVMTSPDGIVWTSQASAVVQWWNSVIWSPELGLFCAVGEEGVAGIQIMTSPDGITWTSRAAPSDQEWMSITWSPELGLFCAVAKYGAVGVQVMTSPDGITWTSRTSASAQQWSAIIWSPELGLFCAVATNGLVGVQVMTSPDGITWTSGTSTSAQQWMSITWSPELGLFCAVADNGAVGVQVMTSASRKYSTATSIGALIGSAADATPNDTDFVATSLTANGVLKKITWTNVKAFLKTYFDTLYPTISNPTFTGNVKKSTTAAITAFATGGQASAVALASDINEVSVCATAADSVKLPAAIAGMEIMVVNHGAAAMNLFPAVGDFINEAAVDTAVSIGIDGTALCYCYIADYWEIIEAVRA